MLLMLKKELIPQVNRLLIGWEDENLRHATAKQIITGLICAGGFMGIYCIHSIGWLIGGKIASTTFFIIFSQIGALLGGIIGIYTIVLVSNSSKMQNKKMEFFEIEPIEFSKIVPIKKIKMRDVCLILLIVVFQFPLSNLLSEFGKRIFGSYTESFGVLSEKTDFFVFVLAIAILGPILEEVLIRGVVLYQFQLYSPVFAITITTVAFSIMHGNPHQAFYTLSSSIAYTIVTFATGSIIASILAHVLHNFIVSIFLYSSLEINFNQWYVVLPCTMILVFLLYCMLKEGKGMQYWNGKETNVIFPFIYLITFTAFFVMKLLSYSLFIFCALTCIMLYIYKQVNEKSNEKRRVRTKEKTRITK